jgi:hypothetical protein
LASA